MPSRSAAHSGPPTTHNLSLLWGELSSVPEVRLLDSGTRLATLQVRVRDASSPATSVPVAMWDPPSLVESLAEGDEVVVLGQVRRRFFRTAGGQTGSRVEVVAEVVAEASDRRRVRAILRRVHRAVEAP